MRRSRTLLPCLTGLALLALPLTAAAGTDTGTLAVTATVESSCALDGGTLNFGQYNSGQQTDLDVEGSISYSHCSGTLSFALDGGTSGNINSRTMVSGDNELSYQLYRNSNRSAVWGSGAQAHEVLLFEVESGTVPVYGRILAGQLAAPGSYSDTVTITMTF